MVMRGLDFIISIRERQLNEISSRIQIKKAKCRDELSGAFFVRKYQEFSIW